MSTLKIDLDWEERLFTSARSLLRRLRGKSIAPPRQAEEAEERPLALLASLLAGRTVELVAGGAQGGIRGDSILLSSRETCPPELRRLAVIHGIVCAASVIRHAGRISERSSAMDSPAGLLLLSLRLGAAAKAEALETLPVFATRDAELSQALLALRPPLDELTPLQARLESTRRLAMQGDSSWDTPEFASFLEGLPAGELAAGASPHLPWGELLALPAPDQEPGIDPDFLAPETPDGTEIDGLATEDPVLVKLNRKDLEDQVLMHVFEKVETADDYTGGTRQLDGEDELESQLEAIRELNMKHMIRGGADTHSIYKASMRMNAEIPDLADCEHETGIAYDEWDQRRSRYRRGWCQVFPAEITAMDPEWTLRQLATHGSLIRQLEARLRRHRSRRQLRTGLGDGPEIDLNAWITSAIDIKAGHSGSDHIYMDLYPGRRELSIGMLLDCSLSTDGWADNRRVLDIARESVFALGECLHRLGDEFSIHSFASKTRNRCRVWSIKQSEEAWSLARHRLGALEPMGYTRIGPALRHCISQLKRRPAKHKLLLLLSDGKPNDHDRYEGRYGIADIRKAFQEAREDGVQVHAFALGSDSRTWLPEMAGKGHWHVMRKPGDMLHGLADVYGQISS